MSRHMKCSRCKTITLKHESGLCKSCFMSKAGVKEQQRLLKMLKMMGFVTSEDIKK